MRQTIDILVVEDNEYYNNLLFNALQQSIYFVSKKMKYKMVFHSFTDYTDCISRIRSHQFADNDLVAFVDSNMGSGNYGEQIIRFLKDENSRTMAVLLLQSNIPSTVKKNNEFDYVVIKDTFAPALCRLYLDQYIENKFL
jgi:hypothetical protein